MNKLTIEQLKALPRGEWVWVVTLQDYYRPNDVPYGEYHEIVGTCSHYYFEVSYDKSNYYQLAYSTYGTEWLAYKNKQEAEGEYDSLAVELEAIKQDKANLERTIEEMNEVLEANGITIDSDGNVSDSRVEQAKRQTAKAIIGELKGERRTTMNEIEKMAKVIDSVLGSAPTFVLQSRGTGEYKSVTNSEVATALVNAGYGDIKQAVREFVEKIKENLEEIFDLAVRKNWGSAYEYINELVKKVCRE